MQQLSPEASDSKAKGNAAFKQKQYDQAVKWYSQAIHLCGNGPAAVTLYSNRSAAYCELGRFEDALGDACNSVTLDNRWAKGYYRAAKAMMGLGRPADAVGMLESAANCCGKPSEEISQLLEEARQQVLAAADNDLRQHSPPLPASSLQHLSCTTLDPSVIPSELRGGHVFQASSDGVNENVLLLLHGLGDTAAPFAGLAAKMALPQTASLAVSAPFRIPLWEGGRQWFQSFRGDGELLKASSAGKVRVDGLLHSVALLKQLLANLVAAGWPHNKVHLFGFSQGGTVALQLARSYLGDEKLGGCMVVSSSILEELLEAEEKEPAAGHSEGDVCPVLFIHGSEVELVPLDLVERSRRLLESSCTSAEASVIQGKGHGMLGSQHEVRVAMGFWGKTLSYRPPDSENLVEVTRHLAGTGG